MNFSFLLPVSRIAAVFLGPLENTLSDTANISIHPFGDEVYSLAETPFAHRIDLESLETTETVRNSFLHIYIPNPISDLYTIRETMFIISFR